MWLFMESFWEDNAKGLEQHGQEIAPMNELICSIIHIYYGRIPLQTDFFLPLIKPVFQHQHIKSVNIGLIRAIPHKERTAKRSEKRYNKEVKKRTESPPSKRALLHCLSHDVLLIQPHCFQRCSSK